MNDTAQPFVGRGKSLLQQLLRSAQTRLELLALELEEERAAIRHRVRVAVIGALCAWLAGFTLVLWIALAFPPNVRFIALGIVFALFALGTLVSWILLRRAVRHAPLFSRLIEQLRRDRAALGDE